MPHAKVTYYERGTPQDFKRIDTKKSIIFIHYFWGGKSGNLLYGYIDRFNVLTIAKEDIENIEYLGV